MIQPSPYPYIFILSAGGDAQQSHCKSCISQSGFHQVHLRSTEHQRVLRQETNFDPQQCLAILRPVPNSTCLNMRLRTTSNLMFEQFELDQENTRNCIAALNFCTGGTLCCCACLHLWFAVLSRYPTLWQFGIFMYFLNFFFLMSYLKKAHVWWLNVGCPEGPATCQSPCRACTRVPCWLDWAIDFHGVSGNFVGSQL